MHNVIRTTDLSAADRVWNRAALESGGESPGPGDRALASLLLAHGLAMNGGIHHVLDVLSEPEQAAAVDGFQYFGLTEVAAFLRGASSDPMLLRWTAQTEHAANQRYVELVPDEDHLARRFEAVFRDRSDQFSPIDEGAV